MSKDDGAKRWFHGAAWIGLGATVYTNYQAAPVADLQVAYLTVPVLLAGVSEGLIRNWTKLPTYARLLLSSLAFLLVSVSYEHFRHMILEANGTQFAANVGAAVIDLTIFGCVLATCLLSALPGSGSVPVAQPEPESDIPVPVVPEIPEAGMSGSGSVPVPVLSVPVPEIIPIPVPAVPETRALPASGIPVPAVFVEPPGTGIDGPVAPDLQGTDIQWDALTVDDFAPSDDAPVSPAPTGRKRSSDGTDLRLLALTFGQELPSTTEIMTALQCGGSKATRLRALWADHLESNGNAT